MVIRRRTLIGAAVACGLLVFGRTAYTAGIDTQAVQNTVLGSASVQVSGGVLLGLTYAIEGTNVASVQVTIEDDFSTPLSQVVAIPSNGSNTTCQPDPTFGVNGYREADNRTRLVCTIGTPSATLATLTFAVTKGV